SYVAISFCSASCMANSVFRAGLFPAVSMSQKRLFRARKGAAHCGARLHPVLTLLTALEGQLQSELDQTRIARALHAPEIAAVREVAVWLKELCVVEGVKQFAAKLQ